MLKLMEECQILKIAAIQKKQALPEKAFSTLEKPKNFTQYLSNQNNILQFHLKKQRKYLMDKQNIFTQTYCLHPTKNTKDLLKEDWHV